MVCIQASASGQLRNVELSGDGGRIYIFIGDSLVSLDPSEAIVLRDKLADALTQASIQRDAKAAAGVVA